VAGGIIVAAEIHERGGCTVTAGTAKRGCASSVGPWRVLGPSVTMGSAAVTA
jgi:hypothetical protein